MPAPAVGNLWPHLPVRVVFLAGDVRQILRPVVCTRVVQVIHFHTLRTWTVPRQGDDLMDAVRLPVERCPQVAGWVWAAAKYVGYATSPRFLVASQP